MLIEHTNVPGLRYSTPQRVVDPQGSFASVQRLASDPEKLRPWQGGQVVDLSSPPPSSD